MEKIQQRGHKDTQIYKQVQDYKVGGNMNWMSEINAFYDWLEVNELNTSAIALWQALMHTNNKARWSETFTVAESTLRVKTGLAGRTVRDARGELKQKGLIDFKSRKGGKSAIYAMISFEKGINPLVKPPEMNAVGKTSTEIDSVDNAEDSAERNAEGSAEDSATLNKQEETRREDTIDKLINNSTKPLDDLDIKRVFDMWQSNIGIPSAIEIKNLSEWVNDLSADLVCYAIENVATLDHGKRNYKYINGILKNWDKSSLKTVEDVKAYELTRQQKKTAPGIQQQQSVVKRTPFNSVQGREWDFNELERLERERMKKMFGVIDGAVGAS